MSEDYPGQAYVHKHNANIKRAEENAMSEQRAGRGEGLAGAIACVKEFIAWATEQIGTSEAHGCAEQAEDALKLLEAAAPAGTAPDDDDECSARDNKYQCTLPKEHAGPHKAHGFQRVLHEWAALATPSPQPYNSEQEFGKSGVGPLIGPDGSGSATGANLQQPAGSGALDRERCEGLYLKFSEPLMEPHTPVIIERVNGNCTVSQFIIARDEAHQLINQLSEFLRVGSPRKVGEDGASERIWCMECGKSVSTPVPKDTIVRAWVQCPECIEKGKGLCNSQTPK